VALVRTTCRGNGDLSATATSPGATAQQATAEERRTPPRDLPGPPTLASHKSTNNTMRAVAGLVAVQVALRATLCLAEGENVCSLETGLCTCEEEAEEKRTRCEGLKPIFESAGSHCVHYNSDSASCEAEENHGYCEWKGVMV
jgi:hypothetical protein